MFVRCGTDVDKSVPFVLESQGIFSVLVDSNVFVQVGLFDETALGRKDKEMP